MLIFRILLILCALTGLANSQTREVKPANSITLGVGQTRIYRFDEPISQVNVISKGIVEANALSDRQISLVGVAIGETVLNVFGGDKDRLLFDATVTVNPESGHIVKIYGTGKNDDANAGFIQVYCNQLGCGRPDRDLPVPNITVERISRTEKDKK